MLLSPEQIIADLASRLGLGIPTLTALILILALWSVTWKGLALWKSAKRNEKWWFIALLLINTVGILEILYLYVFSKKGQDIPKSEI